MKRSLLLALALFGVILASSQPASAQVAVRVGPVRVFDGGPRYYGPPAVYVNPSPCYYDDYGQPICSQGYYDPYYYGYYGYYGPRYNYVPRFDNRRYEFRGHAGGHGYVGGGARGGHRGR